MEEYDFGNAESEDVIYPQSVTMPFLSARKMPDPFNPKVTIYEFFVDVRALPEMPMDANARPSSASKSARVYKSVRNSLLDGLNPDGTFNLDEPVTASLFGIKHLGINTIASKVEEIDKNTAVLHFNEGEGVMNGGHGLAIALETQKKIGPENMPPNFIKVSVVVGLKSDVISEVAGANNTSVQVKIASILELNGAFDAYKGELAGTNMESSIAWREGDFAPGKMKVEDLIAVLTCFRSDVYPPDNSRRSPHKAYAYKTGVMEEFRRDQDGYAALIPRLREILEFQDYVRTQPKAEYNQAGGRFGALKFVDSVFVDAKGDLRKKRLDDFVMPYTGEKVTHRLNIAAVYPILAAFRLLLRRNASGDAFEWIMPFSEVKTLWNEISVKAMEATKIATNANNNVLNSLAMSRPHWQNMLTIVENAMLRHALKMSQAETVAALN